MCEDREEVFPCGSLASLKSLIDCSLFFLFSCCGDWCCLNEQVGERVNSQLGLEMAINRTKSPCSCFFPPKGCWALALAELSVGSAWLEAPEMSFS